MTRGGHRSASGRGTVEAGPGDVITVNPGEVHDGAPIGPKGRSWFMLYLDPAIVAEAAGDIAEKTCRHSEFVSPVVQDRRVAFAVHHLFNAATGAAQCPLQLDEALLSALGPLLQSIPHRLTGIPTAIYKARSMMDEDPASAVSLAVLAQEAGLSRYQFLRAFARQTGLTPHTYLVQRRLRLARQLIRRGMAPAEVAVTCGFADQSHLTRLFVRTYGLTPGTYARAMR